MVCIPSELRFPGVSEERALWIYMDTEPPFWRVHTDRQNDSLRSLWLFCLGFAVRKMNVISNHVLGDTCDTLG